MAILGPDPQHIDEIVVACSIAAHEGAALMTMLELQGLVRNVGAQHYVATRSRSRRTG